MRDRLTCNQGRISSMEAPVVPSKLEARPPSARKSVFQPGDAHAVLAQVNAAGDDVKRPNQRDESRVILRRMLHSAQGRRRQNENVITDRDGRETQSQFGIMFFPPIWPMQGSTAMQASNSPNGRIIHGVGTYTGIIIQRWPLQAIPGFVAGFPVAAPAGAGPWPPFPPASVGKNSSGKGREPGRAGGFVGRALQGRVQLRLRHRGQQRAQQPRLQLLQIVLRRAAVGHRRDRADLETSLRSKPGFDRFAFNTVLFLMFPFKILI
jgi:hypothetical protein